MGIKVMYWPTNFNNKLACEKMAHIDFAPAVPLLESQLHASAFEIRTSDNSHPPTQWKLMDIIRLRLEQIHTTYTWVSHGMDYFDFVQLVQKQRPGTNSETAFTIYFYQRKH